MKKLVKYVPVVYAVWSNPEMRAKLLSAVQNVNGALQRLVNDPEKVNSLVDKGAGAAGVKGTAKPKKAANGVLRGVASASNMATTFLAKRASKASAAK